MAKKITGNQVFTGQLLKEGLVVFLTKNGTWSTDLQDAAIATSAEELTALEKEVETLSSNNDVIDVYPFVVVEADGKIMPEHIRERIRTEGPTIEYMKAS